MFSIINLINFATLMIGGNMEASPAQQHSSHHMPIEHTWTLNTSNPGKLEDYKRLLTQYGASITAQGIDLHEILADPITVAVHKASQIGEGILIEDTSFDIEGADIGVNIRWLQDNLAKYEGRKALWRVLIAYQKDNLIYVHEGKVSGTIVQPRGENGFGFDSVFLPDGSSHTLAEKKYDATNARAKAVESLFMGAPIAVLAPITEWEGAWQSD